MTRGYKYNIILCLFFFVLCFISIFYVYNNFVSDNIKVNLIIEIKTETDDAYQVFYDTGKGFNETESVPQLVTKSPEFQRIEFPLPVTNINSLRLDFGSKITQIQMNEIYLQSKTNIINITSKFDSKNDIGQYIIQDQKTTEINTIGNDAFIYTKNISDIFQNINKQPNYYFDCLFISIFLTIVFFFFIKVNTVKIKEFTNYIIKNIKPSITIAFFILILFILFFSNFIPKNQVISNIENRILTSKPKFDIHNINIFPNEFEKYFNDNFALRNQLLKINNYTKVKFLHISPNPLVVVGKNDWLFYTGNKAPESMDDYKGVVRFSDDELWTIKNNLEERKEWLNQKGITYLFCIAPNKQTIYPEYLPSNIKKINIETRMDQLVDFLNQYSNIDVLDLRKVLIENKGKDMLYFKTDTHWNEYGAYLGYQEILKRLSNIYPNMQPIQISTFTLTKSNGSGGDLANMLVMKNQFNDDYIHLSPQYKTFAKDIKVKTNLYPNPESLVTKQTNDLSLPNLLMFRDSFSTSLIPLLSEHFNKSIYIWDHKLDAKIIEMDKPNIVIEEIVERLIPSLLIPNLNEFK
ncbi:hypothetical protein GC096_19540 [Paenibacillus sp. LMG 31461]|uniref:AlgX/AlgJ SGNH hydrolase-like domain-containing protein n=1 Tax=Paenibacillus plantarum TaxID=2654975 RepID=A0ABX1XCP2_9BACL|nr:hypothetical protein [Paenibacillus plantarum]NOU66237.1 hypothetical protein [Paenibacillus plantarum]